MCDSQTKTEEQRQALAEFVRQETDGGREIMRFFLDVLRGRFDDAKMCHRIAAAQELAKHRSLEARAFLKAVGRSENGRAPRRAPVEPGPKDELADFIKEETDDGKEVIRFYLNVVRNRVEDARIGHKISAAKELLRRAFDIVPQRTGAGDDPHQGAKECRIDKCDHATYTRYRWMVDGRDREALEKIYGSKEAVSFVRRAVVDHRKKNVFDHTYVPDHDFTPIDNPEDDPYGKGSFGYEVLCEQFGDNQAIRVANKAAEEYNRKLAEDHENEKDSNEDPPAAHSQDSPAEADSNPAQYTEDPPAPAPPFSSSTDPPDNDPPTPEPLRRSGRRRKHRLLAASRSGPVAANSDRGPPSPAAV